MEKFVLSLLFCSLEMSVVSLLYLGLLKALKNRQMPVLRYYSWLVIIVGFLFPIKPNFGKAAVTINELPVTQDHTEPSMAIAAQSSSTPNIYQIIFAVWLTVAVLYLITSLCRYKSFRRSVKRLSAAAGRNTLILAKQTARSIGIKAPIKVVIIKGISSPMMIGLLAPTILLPDRQFDKIELQLILKHELTHFKHKDLWFNLLMILCRAVHWFNPIMIAISRSIEQECEHYCDFSVVKNENVKTKKLYCRSILNTVSEHNRYRKTKLHPVMATNFYTPKQGLKHRLGMIISGKRKRKFALVMIIAVVLTIASGSVVAFASDTEKSQKSERFGASIEDTALEDTFIATSTIPTETSSSAEKSKNAKTTTTTVTSKADTAPTEYLDEPIVTQAPDNMENGLIETTTTTVTYPYYYDEPIVPTTTTQWNHEDDGVLTTITVE